MLARIAAILKMALAEGLSVAMSGLKRNARHVIDKLLKLLASIMV